MRWYTKELLLGTIEEQFGKLWSYAAKVYGTNLCLTVYIAINNQVSQGIYICFEACKIGFIKVVKRLSE